MRYIVVIFIFFLTGCSHQVINATMLDLQISTIDGEILLPCGNYITIDGDYLVECVNLDIPPVVFHKGGRIELDDTKHDHFVLVN